MQKLLNMFTRIKILKNPRAILFNNESFLRTASEKHTKLMMVRSDIDVNLVALVCRGVNGFTLHLDQDVGDEYVASSSSPDEYIFNDA